MLHRWNDDRDTRFCSMASDLLLLGVGGRAAGVGAPNYLVQETDGVSRFTLEDASGNFILE